jgi:hypothetical protein
MLLLHDRMHYEQVDQLVPILHVPVVVHHEQVELDQVGARVAQVAQAREEDDLIVKIDQNQNLIKK